MNIKAIVVDDEPLARQRLSRLLSELGVDVVAQGKNGNEALLLSNQHQAEIVFLDINMPILNGIDAAKEIVRDQTQPPAIVFCTAYDEYALDAFDASAAAYLLKPVNQTDLKAAIEKAQSVSKVQIETLLNQQLDGQSTLQRLAIKNGSQTENIPASEFVYFLTIEKNVYAKRIDMPEMLVAYTLKEIEKLLEGVMVRIHRNCLVNPEYLQKLIRDGSNTAKVSLLNTDKEFDVSRRHLKRVKECFQ
ncbi:MAG: LytTR family DNA-binding domain-containing protein [Acidiferrobacterales bacterium]|nr:LytTR family DNA-binding domain-containing protein [Acidiferrobacterales bacterium]